MAKPIFLSYNPYFPETKNGILMENPYVATKEVSLGDWILTLFLLAIPVINIVMLFVWAFSSGTPVSKANFAKATLIWIAILFVLSLIGMGLGFSIWQAIY